MAYIEIDKAPYLVLSSQEAFDSGERPINVDVSNIVWLDPPGMSPSAIGPKLAFLWGTPQDDETNGTLVKLPTGYRGKIRSHGSTFRAVVIQGQPQHRVPGKTDIQTLEPGGYYSSTGGTVHQISSNSGAESIIYVRTDGKYDVVAEQPTK